FGKINTVLSESKMPSEDCESLDLFGLSRFLQRRGESTRAQTACSQALAIGLPAEVRAKAQRELAQMFKRRREYACAAQIWEEMLSSSQDDVHACEQLAIHHERRAKDVRRAIEFTKLGLAKLRRETASSRVSRDPYLAARYAGLEKNFTKRL